MPMLYDVIAMRTSKAEGEITPSQCGITCHISTRGVKGSLVFLIEMHIT